MGVKDKFCNSKIKGVFCMYKGDYDQEAIFLTKELDRKRIENEKCEAILYQADYEFLNSWNKDIRETRVVKFIHDNGEVYHGIPCGIDADKNAPNDFASGDFWYAETDTPGDLEETPCEIWLGNRDIDGNIDWNNSVCLNAKALKEWAANYDNNKDIEISDVFEDDDVIYFHIAKNGRGGYQNVELNQLKKYLPHEEDNTDEEFEKAICNWAKDNLDISKLPHIEDTTPAMQYLYNRVSSSENNMYYLDDVEDFNDELGMSQEEFEKQVDSDVEKYGLENVVVKNFDEALYACFGNLQCSFTEKVEQSNEKYDFKTNAELEAITNSVLDGKITLEEADKQYYSVHLKIGDFYKALCNLYRGSTISSEQSLDFMKDVVKEHGTDTEKLNEAVIAVTHFKGETSEFTAKLFQELLNSDEYKKIEREQGQRKVEGVDCVKQANAKTFEQDFSELCKEHNVSPKKAIKAMLNKMVDEKNKQNGVQR